MLLKMVTSFGRSGLQDWLIQRISAVILAAYTLFIFAFWLLQPNIDYLTWQQLFTNVYMKCATLLALLALISHAWIGMWIISTDYVKKLWLRLPIQICIYVALLFYLIWGLQILWA